MKPLLLALALACAPAAALACEGNANCTKSGCALPATATTDTLPAEGKRVTLTVTGMSCGACAGKVKTALTGVEGVKGAVVDATTGKAEVAYDEKTANADKLIAAVAATGHFTAAVATP